MRAAVIQSPGVLTVEAVADPTPAPDEVVLEVAAVGICGTDLHILAGDHARTVFPVIPGHEFAGVVVATGGDVNADRLAVGTRVAVDPAIPCQGCFQCRRGRQNACENWQGAGATRPGGMAELVAVPARNCVALPDHMSLGTAALAEPVSCVVRAIDLATPGIGQRAGIYGAGPIGLIMTTLLRDLVAEVAVIDLNADRLEAAARAGATSTGTASAAVVPERGFDLVVDCTGAVPAIEDGIRNLARGGTFLQFGVPPSDALAAFSPAELYRRELRLLGTNSGLGGFDRALDLLARGVVSADLVVSDRFPLADTVAAFDRMRSGAGRKIHIVPNEEIA